MLAKNTNSTKPQAPAAEQAPETEQAPLIQASVRSESVQPDSETVVITQTVVVDNTSAPAEGPEVEYEEVVEEIEGRSIVVTRYNVKASA